MADFAAELLDAKTPLGADLAEGVKAVALNQKIKFKLYGRVVLPLDGWLFWVRADLLAQPTFTTALVSAQKLSDDQMENATFEATGSLHYGTDVRQEETETYAANRIVFTSLEEVQSLNEIAPGTLAIGEFDGLRFAFSSVSTRYKQAGLWHYGGFAVYPDMETQIIDSVLDFSSAQIVSNSLPAWLALNGFAPPYGIGNPGIVLYPSYLVPNNLMPEAPFASVHVEPGTTRGLAMAPHLTSKSSHWQLCAERVKITLWGTRNTNALDFVDCVNQYSLATNAFGLMNIPVVQDEKRTQAELGAIAMKKSITYEISYHQSRIRDIAQKLITKVVPTYYVSGVEV